MRRIISLLIVAQITLAGCEEPEQVRQYRVPKSRSDLGDIGTKKIPTAGSRPIQPAKPVDARMVVGISQRDDSTWFFKVTGSVEAVDNSEGDWKTILKSVTYGDNGSPDWKLPESWKLGPPKQMRYATLLSAAEGADRVEISISSLGPGQDLLNNVNRWRNQLGLEPTEESKLELKTLKSGDGEMKVFDANGQLALSGSMGRPPSPMPPPKLPLTYDVPDGWEEGRTNMMVPVRLHYGTDKSGAQISVTQLLAQANKWIPNTQRWAGQIGMKTDEDLMTELTTEVQVDGLTGQRIKLIPDDEQQDAAIIGVMVVRKDLAWFFKFIGEKEFVANNETVFDEFLSTFKFE